LDMAAHIYSPFPETARSYDVHGFLDNNCS
jgi:hypothetical protein